MAEPIYKFFMGRRSEAWHQLSKEEQNTIEAKLNEAREKVGAKRLIICNPSWSSDQWSYAGVEEFPDIEAVQKYMEAVNELNLFRYIEATSFLGTKFETE